MLSPELGGAHAAARVHHAARRCSSGVAARGARAAGRADAAHRHPPERSLGRSAISGPRRGVPAGTGSNWAGPSAATCGSTPAGPRPMPPRFADTRRNWPRSRRTSSWPMAPRPVGPLLQATRTVPIVFPVVVDPVGAGFVDSLARPGGNATGFMAFEYSMSGKWLELLKQIAPGVTRVAVLRDPAKTCRHRPVRRNPGRGAVARGGGEPGQRARRRRDRARRRGLRARSEWRPDRDGERGRDASSRSDHHAGGPAQAARGLLRTLLRRRRRPDLLRG